MNPQRSTLENRHEIHRKKRLGQFFTGERLSMLLATLAAADNASSVMDPMCGDGDLLAACRRVGKPTLLCGLDVDAKVLDAARRRLSERNTATRVYLAAENAFARNSISNLPIREFDLVIANPPYVRYQSLSAIDSDVEAPTAAQVRKQLSELLDEFPSLDSTDRRLFGELVSGYSGLSDLAVPSWILCALLTRVGGTLAIVVPETWLSRDYAQVIQYMLLRWFRITHIVEDANAAWFPGVLVKTTLLVAERTARHRSAFEWQDEGYVHCRIASAAANNESVVGNAFRSSKDADQLFAEQLLAVQRTKRSVESALWSAEWTSLTAKADNLRSNVGTHRWLGQLEPSLVLAESGASNGVHMPPRLRQWLSGTNATFVSLAEIGASVGQGLRTGANDFFYVDAEESGAHESLVRSRVTEEDDRITVPNTCLRPVIRKQSELPAGHRVRGSDLPGRVLSLQSFALPEDLAKLRLISAEVWHTSSAAYTPMPQQLASLVRRAAGSTSRGAKTGLIPELSAVRTNVREVTAETTLLPRWWYMLPRYVARHVPDLLIARVISDCPRALLNAQRGCVVDANFSTVWQQSAGAIATPSALLAMLNSTWCLAAMELSGAVMGAGALKLEATHLRRLPIPKLSSDDWHQLSELGSSLCDSTYPQEITSAIDRVVIGGITGAPDKQRSTSLRELLVDHVRERHRRA